MLRMIALKERLPELIIIPAHDMRAFAEVPTLSQGTTCSVHQGKISMGWGTPRRASCSRPSACLSSKASDSWNIRMIDPSDSGQEIGLFEAMYSARAMPQ